MEWYSCELRHFNQERKDHHWVGHFKWYYICNKSDNSFWCVIQMIRWLQIIEGHCRIISNNFFRYCSEFNKFCCCGCLGSNIFVVTQAMFRCQKKDRMIFYDSEWRVLVGWLVGQKESVWKHYFGNVLMSNSKTIVSCSLTVASHYHIRQRQLANVHI